MVLSIGLRSYSLMFSAAVAVMRRRSVWSDTGSTLSEFVNVAAMGYSRPLWIGASAYGTAWAMPKPMPRSWRSGPQAAIQSWERWSNDEDHA